MMPALSFRRIGPETGRAGFWQAVPQGCPVHYTVAVAPNSRKKYAAGITRGNDIYQIANFARSSLTKSIYTFDTPEEAFAACQSCFDHQVLFESAEGGEAARLTYTARGW